ncbi:MAG: calcium/sodium antiporter [Corallococcus sp.]|nr:calcium/sodium antiporter [Bacillota bacterium]MCM1534197.1 calcium/sodium antiporter [Corallococcus sp.]
MKDIVELLNRLVENWHPALQIAMYVAGLALGVFCLVKFCDIFVDSSSSIAKRLKVSPLIIGLTIVAMGTSLPELAVSVSDSITALSHGSNADIAIGNVVGSNICNILLVLGFSVIFTPIAVKKNVGKRELPILLGVSAITVLFICLFGLNSVAGDFAVTRWEGIILVVIMIAYMTYIVLMAKRHPEQLEVESEDETKAVMPMWKAVILVIVGAIGIILGGQFVVFGAKGLALKGSTAMGLEKELAENLVGLTIVAVGTSLPELVTSVIAAKKGENELALGNVIGSNMFNMLFVMGIAATVNPLVTGAYIIVDALVMLAVTAMLFVFGLRGKLGRAHGIALLCCYAVYLVWLILRTVLGLTF